VEIASAIRTLTAAAISQLGLVRLIKILGITLLVLPLASQATVPGHQVLGKWKFTAIADFAELTSLSEGEAQRLLGRVVIIKKDGSDFDGYRCAPASFTSERVVPSLYLRKDAGIDNSKLKLPNGVTVVDIGCANVYAISPRRVIIDWRGWFFKAIRVDD
jgi:hypothetical protein